MESDIISSHEQGDLQKKKGVWGPSEYRAAERFKRLSVLKPVDNQKENRTVRQGSFQRVNQRR